MAIKETGIQFLARLRPRPSIVGLEPMLFGEGPQCKDTVELYGSEGVGKTELLVHLMTRLLLPEQWNNIPLAGHKAGVIFIDTENKFCILRLVGVMEKYVAHKASKCSKQDVIDANVMEEFIGECLKRLHVIRISSSEQLVITLHGLESLICSEPTISTIMIDSISAFYWLDRYTGGDSIHHQESNMKLATEVLSKLINAYNLVLFATKAEIFRKKKLDATGNRELGLEMQSNKCTLTDDFQLEHSEFMCKTWQRLVSHRLVLVKECEVAIQSGNRTCTFLVGGDYVSENKRFSVTESGILFQ